jgi:protein tyrosine phosphatase
MDDYQIKNGGDAPILVHCSAGVGRLISLKNLRSANVSNVCRTGSVIGVDIIRNLIREHVRFANALNA